MKTTTLIGAAALLTFTFTTQAGELVDIDNTGLSKGSVFDTPTPSAPRIGGAKPQTSTPQEPPQIPHDTAGMVPVTLASNACLGCHDKPALQGMKMPGMPTAIPASHYMNTRDNNAKGNKVRGQRYVCTQCHAPLTDAKPPVENQF